MALESEPQSTPLGGSNLDALKSESSNNVDMEDLEDGEIDDDDDEADNAMPPVTSASPPAPPPPPVSGPSAPRIPSLLKSPPRREQHEGSGSTLPAWLQRRLGPTPPKKRNKNKQAWGPPPPNSFSHEEDEDDFAVHLEKMLKAKAEQAEKEKAGEEGEISNEGGFGDDEHGPGRRRRKRRKDENMDGDLDFKRKRREGDEMDEDMIFVRGASPTAPNSPPHRDFGQDRSYDSYGEEDDDFDGSPDRPHHGGFLSRGRGRGNKSMRGNSRGRGRMGTPNESGRGGYMNKRGNKKGNSNLGSNANSRGGPANKSQQRGNRDCSQEICMYFMQGKCPKDADECQYSHDAKPKRKMELCKFYNMNCCAKRDKCLYMHKDFPCKYFHTGRKCNSGDKCRYSHEPLTDGTKTVLLKHIELAPKEILGEFRRLTKEQAIQLIDKAAKMRAEGKNPEGMDLLREDNEGDQDDERSHTPMPSSPGEVIQNESDTRRNREEGRRRDHDRGHDRDKHRDRNHSDRRERRERRRKRRWDSSPDNSSSHLLKLQESIHRELQEQDDEEKNERRSSKRFSESSDGLVIDEEDEFKTNKNLKSSGASPHEGETNELNSKDFRDSGIDQIKTENLSEKLTGEFSTESGDDSQDPSGVIPAHLPKRQRELFLRIQQQQREAEHNKESKEEQSDDDAGPGEDDWYSSDEDGPKSLTDVLKNIKQEHDSEKDSARQSSENRPKSFDQSDSDKPRDNAQPSRRPPLLPTPTLAPTDLNTNALNDLVKSSAIDQLLSTIRYAPTSSVSPTTSAESTSVPVSLQSPTSVPSSLAGPSAGAPVRDPRLSRDPRSRSASTATSLSPTTSPSSHVTDTRPDPRLEARVDPRSERRDPRMDRADPRYEASHTAMDSLGSPRSDLRGDPRDHRPGRRSIEGIPSLMQQSIYDGTHPAVFSGAGDVDLRVRNPSEVIGGDTDFRRPNSQFGTGDMDMRREFSNILGSHDTDLRFRMGRLSRDQDEDYSVVSQSDLDLRRVQMSLPFKPAPVHTPATEIDASLASHNPPPYHVVPVDIPKPDLSTLKINSKDPMVKLDPRLRRFFGLQSDSTLSTPSSPPPEPTVQASAPPVRTGVVRTDPRRRNSNTSLSRPADPRQSRMGMGASTSHCPPTPRAEDFDDPMLSDTDLRMQAQFGRQPAPWENTNSRGRGLLPHPDPGWAPNTVGSFGRASHTQPPYHQQRSYTPPPT